MLLRRFTTKVNDATPNTPSADYVNRFSACKPSTRSLLLMNL